MRKTHDGVLLLLLSLLWKLAQAFNFSNTCIPISLTRSLLLLAHSSCMIYERRNFTTNQLFTMNVSMINKNVFPFLFVTDLQLAAELGKTLLERNKELENLLRSHQRKCEDQKQEIEVSSHYT
jgi:hypothetical protein